MIDDLAQLMTVLHLKKMPAILDRELTLAQEKGTSYSDFLARLLREEFHEQQARATASRRDRAKIPEVWTLETFPWAQQPGVDRTRIRELAELDFVGTGTNLVFIGSTGVGKTGLATGLLLKAVEHGHRALFIRAQDLFDELYASLADRATRRYLQNLIRYDVILIDEVGYLVLKTEQINLFFKLMEERYTSHKSTIITTNMEFDDWGQFLGNRHLTDALLGRLRQRCVTLRIDGTNLRLPPTL